MPDTDHREGLLRNLITEDSEDTDNSEGDAAEKGMLDDEQDGSADESSETPDEEAGSAPDESGSEAGESSGQLDQRLEGIMSRFEKAVATVENASNRARNNPTEQNVEAARKAKTRIDKVLESEDLEAYPELRAIAEGAKEIEQRYEERVAALEAQIQAQAKTSIAQAQQAHREQFAKANPEIADQYDALMDALADRVGKISGYSKAQPALQDYILEREWSDVLATAKKKAQQSDNVQDKNKGKTDAVKEKKPTHTQPVRSRSGQAAKPPDSPEARMEALRKNLVTQDAD